MDFFIFVPSVVLLFVTIHMAMNNKSRKYPGEGYGTPNLGETCQEPLATSNYLRNPF
ncbi:MAG: hypothetical protein QXQ46_10815 [Thermoplasmatales archaeon]